MSSSRFTQGRSWFCAAALCSFAALARSLGVEEVARCGDGEVCDAGVRSADATLGSSLMQHHATISTESIEVHSDEVVEPPTSKLHCTSLCENLESSPWPDATNADAKALFVEDCVDVGHAKSLCVSVGDEAWKGATADARFLDSSPKEVCAEVEALVQAHEAFVILHDRAASLSQKSSSVDRSTFNKSEIGHRGFINVETGGVDI